MNASRSLLGCTALLVCACSTAKDSEQENPPNTFANTVDILETRQGAKQSQPPHSGLVDYESGITVRPDRSALARLIGTMTGTDPSLGKSELDQLDAQISSAELNLEQLDSLSAITDTITAYEALSDAFFSQPQDPTSAAQETMYQNLLQQRAKVIKALDKLTRVHVERVLLGQTIAWDASPPPLPSSPEGLALIEANALHDRIYLQMAPSPRGGPSRYEAEQVKRVLNETTSFLRNQVADLEKAIIKRAAKAVIEMEANLYRGGKPLAVSITPYTIVEGPGRGTKSPRVGIPSQADVERIQKGYAEYNEIADSLNNLKQLARDDEAIKKLATQFKAELKATAKRLNEKLIARLEAAMAVVGTPYEDLRTKAKDLRDTLAMLKQAVETLTETKDPALIALRTSTLLDQLSKLDLVTRVTDVKDSVITILANLPGDVTAEIKKIIEDLQTIIEKEADDLIAALKGAPGGNDIAQIFRSVNTLHDIANSRSWGDLETGKITRKSFGIENAQDGFVDLANSPAESGDRLAVTYKVTVNPDAQEEEHREYHGSSWLGVRKFGMYTTLKSQLIFYDRVDDNSSSFRAAPAVGYNFHYQPDGWASFWDTTSPGLGLSVSTPSFDSGVDVAVGLQLTLFDDMLQVGYAYNISVDDDREMLYFGLDLIGAFQKFPN